jgi:hypothetical protein
MFRRWRGHGVFSLFRYGTTRSRLKPTEGGCWRDQFPRETSPGVTTGECSSGRRHEQSPRSLAALGTLPQGLLIFGGEKRTGQAGFHASPISGWRPPLGPSQHDAHAHDGQEHEPYRQEDSHGFTVSLQAVTRWSNRPDADRHTGPAGVRYLGRPLSIRTRAARLSGVHVSLGMTSTCRWGQRPWTALFGRPRQPMKIPP